MTVAEIEELLREFYEESKDDHAAAVAVLLRNARDRGLSDKKSITFDEVSPFAAMKSVQIDPDDRKVSKKSSVAVDSFVSIS